MITTVGESKRLLLENARAMSRLHERDVAEWGSVVKHSLGQRQVCLPGYIPFVGARYFDVPTRVMAYALSQNISPDTDFAIEWARDWYDSSGEVALDRQNVSFAREGSASMSPFDTGHLPILCALARAICSPPGSNGGSIYEEIAATNLSKYSFRSSQGHTCDSEISLRSSFDWYSAHELDVLRPQVVIAAGGRVAGVIRSNTGRRSVRVVGVHFPNNRVINLHYRKKFPVTSDEISELQGTLSHDDLRRRVGSGSRTLGDVIVKDAAYFWPVYGRMKSVLRDLSAG